MLVTFLAAFSWRRTGTGIYETWSGVQRWNYCSSQGAIEWRRRWPLCMKPPIGSNGPSLTQLIVLQDLQKTFTRSTVCNIGMFMHWAYPLRERWAIEGDHRIYLLIFQSTLVSRRTWSVPKQMCCFFVEVKGFEGIRACIRLQYA